MEILLIAGGMHNIALNYREKKTNIVNKDPLFLDSVPDFIETLDIMPKGLLIIEQSSSNQFNDNQLINLLEWMKDNNMENVPVVFLTRDYYKGSGIISKYSNVTIIVSDYIRIPIFLLKEAYKKLNIKEKENLKEETQKEEKDIVKKKKSILDRFRLNTKKNQEIEATEHLTNEFDKISKSICRVIAITGHRVSGVTSSVVNIATEASKRGLNTMIIDMDIDYRSTNMYFSEFHEKTKKDEEINASLIRTLAKPQDYKITTFNVKDNLWLTSLGYDFNDTRLIQKFYNSVKFSSMISVFRNQFNLVILDMPLDLLKNFKDALIYIDIFGLCVSNNLHSVLSTLRNLEVVFDPESILHINAKSKLLVTKYNNGSRFQGDIFTQDKICEVMISGLSDYFTYPISSAGIIPYSQEFDLQIERDIPIIKTSKDFEEAFGNILLRLVEGAK
ncbi:MAG: AAA family ATPase [Clostridium sp.]|nr:AAA family ATPase [Clostridium sp.]